MGIEAHFATCRSSGSFYKNSILKNTLFCFKKALLKCFTLLQNLRVARNSRIEIQNGSLDVESNIDNVKT